MIVDIILEYLQQLVIIIGSIEMIKKYYGIGAETIDEIMTHAGTAAPEKDEVQGLVTQRLRIGINLVLLLTKGKYCLGIPLC